MTYEPLHHKYRPQTFAELVGQEAIAATLTNAIRQQKIAPAYLFTGARGTGKTSSARILAKSLNCLRSQTPTEHPCGQCETCQAIARGAALDIIEIDAASNTGVDNIRELIERAQFAPVQCRYKVYVVDECLTGDSLIKTSQGTVRLDDPGIVGKEVLSYNEMLGRWEFKKVVRWLDQGARPIFVIETNYGKIRCTANHLIRTATGWIAARDVKEGTKILSPVPADVEPLSISLEQTDVFDLEQTDVFDDLHQDTSSGKTPTGRKTTTLTPFLEKLSHFAPSVLVDVVSSFMFPASCEGKATGFEVSWPIGKGILSSSSMVSGKLELKSLSLNSAPFHLKHWDSSTELCWATVPSAIPINTVVSQDFLGHMENGSKNGWSTKQPDYLNFGQASDQLQIRGLEKSPSVVVQPVIPNWLKFSRLLRHQTQKLQKNTCLKAGSDPLRLKAWLGGIWMMDHLASALRAVHRSNFIPRVIPLRKTNFLPIGLQHWAIPQKQNLIPDLPVARSIATSQWEQILPENGLPTSSNTQFLQWNTSLAVVKSVHLAGVEQVYDIEVEDNHNFVANGLLVHNCHMLSTAAFNALLKTLEEPPDRVVFVLATTDPQRVLPTIISRCQRFDFRRIPLDSMVKHLGKIAAQEGMAITSGAITLIAQIAQGGLRDAESLLDQLSLLPDTIDVEQVWDLVGSVPERDLLGLVTAIAQDNPEAVIDHTRRLMDRGREPLIVLQNLASFYRDLLIAKTAPERDDLVAITPPTWKQLGQLAESLDLAAILRGQQHLRGAEVQLKNTTQPRLWLEVTLMGLLPSAIAPMSAIPQAGDRVPPPSSPPLPQTPTTAPSQPEPQRPDLASAPKSTSVTNPAPSPTPEPPVAPTTPSPATAPSNTLEQVWQDVISAIKPYSTQVMVRQQCHLLSFDGQQAQLGVSSQPLFKIAQGKLPNIEAAFENVFDRKILVNLVVASSPSPPPAPPAPPPPSPPSSPSPTTGPSSHPSAPSSLPPPQTSDHPYDRPLHPAIDLTSQNGPLLPAQSPTPSPLPPLEPIESANFWEVDEVTQAAKQLANFFAGQVVDLDAPDGTTIGNTTETSLSPPPDTSTLWNSPNADELKTTVEDDEDDEDLPF